MKKILMLFLLIPTVALATNIDANTKIRWNSIVVVAALHDAGLYGDADYHEDVVTMYDNMVMDLLKRKTFSVKEAVSVCMKECNKSVFLKEGRGESGKKCPDICKKFGDSLIIENNKKVTYIYEDGNYHPLGRVYSGENGTGEFYADKSTAVMIPTFDGRKIPCDDAIFESKTNKKIAVCESFGGEDGSYETNFKIIDPRYKLYTFRLYYGTSLLHPDEGASSLEVLTPEESYEELYLRVRYKCDDARTINSGLEKAMAVDKSINLLNSKGKDWLRKAYAERNFIKSVSRFTETSFDLHEELLAKIDKIGAFDFFGPKKVVVVLNRLDALLKDTNRFIKVRVQNAAQATDRVINEIDANGYKDVINHIVCRAACDGLPNTPDDVACYIGPAAKPFATFKFANACDGVHWWGMLKK